MRQLDRLLLTPLLCLAVGTALGDAHGDMAASAEARITSANEQVAVAEGSFDSLDRNRDGRLSRSEAGFDRLLSQTFALIDSDGDGFVTPAEFAAAQRQGPALSQRKP